MTTPAPFFAPDFFATRDVILNRLQKFSLDVILRLGLDNPGGVFTPLITDLATLHTALFGSMLSADAGIALRRGSAPQMWGAIADLQSMLEEDEDLIAYKDKKNPGLYSAFFPNGRTEYGQATLLTADLLFARAEKAALTYATVLGTDFDAAVYTKIYQDFKAARTTTGTGDEQSAKARADAQTQREDLTERLTDAVKLVAAQFLREEGRCNAIFRTELLLRGQPAAAPATPA